MARSTHATLRTLFVAALALASGCASTCPDDGETLSISLVGTVIGKQIGADALTLRSDAHVDRLAVQSNAGDPGVKYTSSDVMCLLYRDLELGSRASEGPLLSGAGFEVRVGKDVVSHFASPTGSVDDALAYKDMLDVFLDYYNHTFALQTVPEGEGDAAIRATQKAVHGQP
ncbi:MAG: hypothetical protein R3F34_01535 [Planctomycetota bacterium]